MRPPAPCPFRGVVLILTRGALPPPLDLWTLSRNDVQTYALVLEDTMKREEMNEATGLAKLA